MEIEKIYDRYFDNLNSIQVYFNKFRVVANEYDSLQADNIKRKIDSILEDLMDDVKSDSYIEKREEINIKEKESENNLGKRLRKNNLKIKVNITNSEGESGKEGVFDKELIKKLSKFISSSITNELGKEEIGSLRNYEILSRGSFLMLNNYFEYLLADILNYYYLKFSGSLNEKEIKVSFKEMGEYSSIEEFKESLVLKEVESIIVEKSFNDLLTHFEKVLNIDLERKLINWDNITEIRERRHLIVHNSSIVNKKYITRTGNPFDFKIGDEVHIDEEYFVNSLNAYMLAGRLILFNCWGEWNKESTSKCIREIMHQTFDDLKNSRYELAISTFDYAKKIEGRNDDEEDFLFRAKFNKAIALKKLGKSSELSKELKTFKVGTASPIFKLCYKILKDDYKGIEELFKKAIHLKELSIDFYLDWPIFEFVRSIDDLNERLIKLFEIEVEKKPSKTPIAENHAVEAI